MVEMNACEIINACEKKIITTIATTRMNTLLQMIQNDRFQSLLFA
jgi:hypothetical protein